MAVTVAALMRHVRNYFETGYIQDEFSINGGTVTPAVKSRYVCIEGSHYNNGVKKILENGAIENPGPDETFDGKIWLLNPPDDFLELAREIAAYDQKNPLSPVMSESFGEYSVTYAGGNSGRADWQRVFFGALIPYRKMYTEVRG